MTNLLLTAGFCFFPNYMSTTNFYAFREIGNRKNNGTLSAEWSTFWRCSAFSSRMCWRRVSVARFVAEQRVPFVNPPEDRNLSRKEKQRAKQKRVFFRPPPVVAPSPFVLLYPSRRVYCRSSYTCLFRRRHDCCRPLAVLIEPNQNQDSSFLINVPPETPILSLSPQPSHHTPSRR